MQNNGALKGITVLDILRLLPGPYCSTILADHGARVIAIEDRRFKDQVTYIEALYRNDDRHRRQVIEFMRRVFKQKTLEEWEQALSRLDVCYQPVQNFEKALKDPFFREHETVLNIPEKAGGNATTIGVPIKLSRTPGAIRSAPVRFGESTAAVLGRLGNSVKPARIIAPGLFLRIIVKTRRANHEWNLFLQRLCAALSTGSQTDLPGHGLDESRHHRQRPGRKSGGQLR